MVTININLPADAGQKAAIDTTQTFPAPQSSQGEKKEDTDAAPKPDIFDASSTTKDSQIPVPAQPFSASVQQGVPQPADMHMTVGNTGNSLSPAPIHRTQKDLSDAPQPAEHTSKTENNMQTDKFPTPHDATPLAKEVNEDIEKAEKKGSRSKASTKKK